MPIFQSWCEIEREIKRVRYIIELNKGNIFMIISPVVEKHNSVKILL